MADNKNKKTYQDILDKSAENAGRTKIGDYKESTGGGTPMQKGDKIDYVADNPQEAESYKKDHPSAIVRVQQPRDEDGQFTYNSVNKRGLKYGPSRGKTVPPFLRGMEVAFAQKSGEGSLILDGKRYKPPVSFTSKEELTQMFVEYSEKDDTFVGLEGKGFGATADTAKGMGGKIGQTDKVVATDYPVVNFQRYMNKIKSQGANAGTAARRIARPKQDNNNGNQMDKNNGNQTDNTNKNTATTPTANGGNGTPTKNVDYGMAKSNPDQFMKDNYDELSSLSQMAKDKGLKMNINKLVGAIGSGQVKDFDSVRKMIEGIK